MPVPEQATGKGTEGTATESPAPKNTETARKNGASNPRQLPQDAPGEAPKTATKTMKKRVPPPAPASLPETVTKPPGTPATNRSATFNTHTGRDEEENHGNSGNNPARAEPGIGYDNSTGEDAAMQLARLTTLEQQSRELKAAIRAREKREQLNNSKQRAATKMAIGKLAKIAKQIGLTIYESVVLVHEAAKTGRTNSDYRIGAQLICNQCEDDTILALYEGKERDTPWPKTTFMNFATLILAHAFTEKWPDHLVNLHGNIITHMAQKKMEPAGNFLQSARTRDAPFVHILEQDGISEALVRTWRNHSQLAALNGLRNQKVAHAIRTHLQTIVKPSGNGFGTDNAWPYMVQTAATAEETANKKIFTAAETTQTAERSDTVSNNKRVDFAKATDILHNNSNKHNKDQTNTEAGTEAARPEQNRSKANLKCFHCRTTGHLATECTGRCPNCQGLKGAHKHDCEKKPQPGGKGEDRKRKYGGKNKHAAQGEPAGYTQRKITFETDDAKRNDRQQKEERKTGKQERMPRTDNNETNIQKRQKLTKEQAKDHRAARADRQCNNWRAKSVDGAKQEGKDEERAGKSNKDSSKDESSQG